MAPSGNVEILEQLINLALQALERPPFSRYDNSPKLIAPTVRLARSGYSHPHVSLLIYIKATPFGSAPGQDPGGRLAMKLTTFSVIATSPA